jgi:hypothetical protein
MSSINPEESTNPEHNLTPAEVENLDRLEAIAQHGLDTYLQVGNARSEMPWPRSATRSSIATAILRSRRTSATDWASISRAAIRRL